MPGFKQFESVIRFCMAFDELQNYLRVRSAGKSLLASLHELLGPRVVVGRVDPLPAAQVGDYRFPPEAFKYYPDLLFRCVIAARHPADAPHEAASFVAALLGLLRGRRDPVNIVLFGHGLAPSTGIYPRELKPADLSISSDPICVPLLLTANTPELSQFELRWR